MSCFNRYVKNSIISFGVMYNYFLTRKYKIKSIHGHLYYLSTHDNMWRRCGQAIIQEAYAWWEKHAVERE